MNNYNGTASPFAIAPFWINKLVASSGYKWAQVGSSSAINAGEGFTMKGTSGVNTTTVNGFKIIQGVNSAMILEENLMMGPFQLLF
jgi:hypothetical protein